MDMSGTNKETREHTSSLPYNNHHSIRDSTTEPMEHGSDPERFSGSGASVTPISVGSRLLSSPRPAVRYRECLKNYAANIGGNVTDGCCEFMPSGNDGTLEAFQCAACSCHRNFHRKEIATAIVTAGHFLQLPPPPTLTAPSPSFSYHHHRHHHQPWASSGNTPTGGSTDPPLNVSPVKIGVGGSGTATESSSEELHFSVGAPSYGVVKKRFRSKFTQEQKDQMFEFAEKVGWRIPREDDPEVQRFCAVVGVKRQVLKVWMHNNKANSGKKHVQDSNETIE